MKFQDLLLISDLDQINQKLKENYFKNLGNDFEYGIAHVFEYISNCEIEPSDIIINVKYYEELDDEGFFGVTGIDSSIKESSTIALYYCLLEEWASFNINFDEVEKIGKYNYLAHCFYEITFNGYSNEDILNAREKLNERIQECEVGWADEYITL